MKHLQHISKNPTKAEEDVSMTLYIEVLMGILAAIIPVIQFKEAADNPWG